MHASTHSPETVRPNTTLFTRTSNKIKHFVALLKLEFCSYEKYPLHVNYFTWTTYSVLPILWYQYPSKDPYQYRYRYPKFMPITKIHTDTLMKIHTDTDISYFPPIPDNDTLTFIPNTSLAAKGALANRLQNPKWPPGGPKIVEEVWKGVYP